MNHRYKQQLRRQQRYLAGQLELLDRRRRAELAAQPRASLSSTVSLSSSGYSASELSESADSPDSGQSEAESGTRSLLADGVGFVHGVRVQESQGWSQGPRLSHESCCGERVVRSGQVG